MKAFIAAILLFTVLVCTAFFTSHALTSAAEDLVKQSKALTMVTIDEREAASMRMEQQWEENRFAISMTINHNEIDILESVFARLNASAKIKDGDDFLIAAAELTASLSHVRDLCAFSLDNIL